MDQTESYPKLELKQFNGFAIWIWKLEQQNCGICRSFLHSKCMQECVDVENAKCPIAMNSCGHAFHQHCIERWINQGSRGGNNFKCAMCDQIWDIGLQTIME